MWLVSTVLDETDIEHFHYHRKFYRQCHNKKLYEIGLFMSVKTDKMVTCLHDPFKAKEAQS